jgi:hypothetical protein
MSAANRFVPPGAMPSQPPAPSAWGPPLATPVDPLTDRPADDRPADDNVGGRPIGLAVLALTAAGLSLLIALVRLYGHGLNADTEQYSTWPYLGAPIAVQAVLAVVGIAAAATARRRPTAGQRPRSAAPLAAVMFTAGFAFSDAAYWAVSQLYVN